MSGRFGKQLVMPQANGLGFSARMNQLRGRDLHIGRSLELNSELCFWLPELKQCRGQTYGYCREEADVVKGWGDSPLPEGV